MHEGAHGNASASLDKTNSKDILDWRILCSPHPPHHTTQMLDKTHGLGTSTLNRAWWWCEIRCHIEIRCEIGPCGPCSPFGEKRPWDMASQVALEIKNPPANAGDIRGTGLIPALGSSPGGSRGNPLQYSCLENPMDWGAWQAIVHSVTKSQTGLKWLSLHTQPWEAENEA